jgi:hypothetical protein
VRLLGTDPPPPGTRPHLNSVGLGVEGGPQTLGGRGIGGVTAATAATAAVTIAVVVVILLLAGLLLLLRVLLGQLLSWWAFLPTGEGRRQWGLLRGVEGSGGGSSGR